MPYMRSVHNVSRGLFAGEGPLGIPRLAAEPAPRVTGLVPYNVARLLRGGSTDTVHFYLDDYRFEALWKSPAQYEPLLRRFNGMVTPDFSLYADWPVAMQAWNLYRSRWLGAYYQSRGIPVVAHAAWSDGASLEWCFDGMPRGGPVSVSSVGIGKDPLAIGRFQDGCEELCRRVAPSVVYHYGRPLFKFPCEVVQFDHMPRGLDQYKVREA